MYLLKMTCKIEEEETVDEPLSRYTVAASNFLKKSNT
jgi:hypothetical protein